MAKLTNKIWKKISGLHKMLEKDDIFNAYKKLKSYAYYDNSNLFLRQQIAEFEYENIDQKLNSLYDKLLSLIYVPEFLHDSNEYFNELIKQMGYRLFPKNFYSEELNSKIISNFKYDKNIKLKRETFFVDAPIELHVVCVLWVVKQGCLLVKEYPNNYGYVLQTDGEEKVTGGLRLFKPYYNEYQKWRDGAIKTAKNVIQDEQNVAIVSLDVKDYYHSIELDEQELLNRLHKDELTKLLLEIYRAYSKIVTTKEKIILPIGFLSSGVLANWYLRDFDKQVKEVLNPVYYGRYVDDILITIPMSDLRQFTNDSDVIEKLFVKESILQTVYCTEEEPPTYYEMVLFKNLRIQQSKISIMLFDYRETIAILDKFAKEIRKSSSEYRFLPDEDLANESFEEASLTLEYDGSIRKLRSIKGSQDDRFGVSSYLAKKIFLALQSPFGTDKTTSNHILVFFRSQRCLEYYSLWEKVLTYFLLTQDESSIKKFVSAAIEAIDEIKYDDDSKLENIKKTLSNHLSISLAMSMSLRIGFFNKRRQKFNFKTDTDLNLLIKQLMNANMLRKQYMKYPLLDYTEEALDGKIELANPYTLNVALKTRAYSPRFVDLYEILLHLYLQQVDGGEIENINYEENFSKAKKFFEEINGFPYQIDKQYERDEDFHEIQKIVLNSSKCKSRLKIGLANINIDEIIFTHKYIRKPTVQIKRRKEINDLLNMTLNDGVDFLVLPECSIPLEWIYWLASFAQKHQIAIIFGLEHIVRHSKAYNILVHLLPLKTDKFNSLMIDFRVKNHYSPEEKRLLEGYGYRIPKTKTIYTLYDWHNVHFTSFNCYELTDIKHRAMFKSKIDLMVASEFNKDISYFSNIVEASARDLHCYFIQSNNAKYGDNRVHQPSHSDIKDIVKIKGGENSTILTATLNIAKLREFQITKYELQKGDYKNKPDFKPTPPDFNITTVRKRIEVCEKNNRDKDIS